MKYKPELLSESIEINNLNFRKRADVYRKMGFDFEASRRFILEAAGRLDGNILEIGSGSGHTTLALARAGHAVTVIDSDEEALKTTALNLAYEGLLPEVEMYVMDAADMIFSYGSFRNVIAVNMFHHVKEANKILSEIERVLSEDGKAVISDFNEEGMRVIDSVHKKEGRLHENSGAGKGHIFSYFKKLGYNIKESGDKYNWIMVCEKERGKSND
jgi:2-polyprenyl-3-methyl-5-hydroxy-6-metoxy-1,4-benzoquinol methylase